MKRYVIIAAGGTGSRMKSAIPKQFLQLAGKPVLIHSINAFAQSELNIQIILVLPENQIDVWKDLCEKHKFSIKHTITKGGKTRFHSVKNGLALIPNAQDDKNSLVAIHDGARPFVSVDLINKVFAKTEKSGNAIPVIPINESIREVKNNQNRAVNRENYFIIQTPQCFRTNILIDAYEKAWHGLKPCHAYTDEASVAEAAGEKINLVEGESRNIKITTEQDLLIAETIVIC